MGEQFKYRPVAAIASSPLSRARDTAAAIAEASGVPCRVEEALVDRDFRRGAGWRRVAVTARFGSLDAAPGVEPMVEVAARAVGCLERLIVETGGPFVVLAHDAVNRAILTGLVPSLGDPEDVPQRVRCWNRVERRSGRWSASVVDAMADDDRPD